MNIFFCILCIHFLPVFDNKLKVLSPRLLFLFVLNHKLPKIRCIQCNREYIKIFVIKAIIISAHLQSLDSPFHFLFILTSINKVYSTQINFAWRYLTALVISQLLNTSSILLFIFIYYFIFYCWFVVDLVIVDILTTYDCSYFKMPYYLLALLNGKLILFSQSLWTQKHCRVYFVVSPARLL